MECNSATSSDKLVLCHFSQQIFQALGYPDKKTAILKKKWRVAATAVHYFHQFYASNTLLDHDPRLLMLCCIFLAGKIEDSFVNISEMMRIYNRFPESRILECEIVLLEGLNFELKAFHPQNCVYSIIADVKKQAQAALPDEVTEHQALAVKATISAVSSEWLVLSEQHLCTLQSTGLVVHVNPLVVAICALKLAEPAGLRAVVSFDAYLVDKFGAEYVQEHITSSLHTVREYLQLGQQWGAQELGATGAADQLTLCMKELKVRNRWKKN